MNDDNNEIFGSKANNLIFLKRNGFNVPEFIVVPYNEIDNNKLDVLENRMKNRMKNRKSDLIIRSSAIGEDGLDNSFAGMFDSVKIKNKNNFIEELKKVINSVNSERLDYYQKNKKIIEKPKLSIFIQDFIEGDVSGVMFSQIIKTGGKGILINSNFGDASLTVDGHDCDSFFIAKNGVMINREVINERPSLTNKQINSLVKLGERIEKLFKRPQDIEWTIKKNKIYVLQSRPITREFSDKIFLWDNSNIAESYSGIVLPLTSSYIKYAYKKTYIDLARRSGIDMEKINENKILFENLLGFFYGRIYYNMLNWYKMLTLYPGYERNKKNFDIMISSKSKEELDAQHKKNVNNLFKAKYYSKLLFRYPFFNSEVEDFKSAVKNYLQYFNKLELNSFNLIDLSKLYCKSANELLSKWSVTVENDFLLMSYFGMLKKFCKKNEIEDKFILFISDIQNVISAKQIDHLKNLSIIFHKFESLVNLAKNKKYLKCFNEIKTNPLYSSFNGEVVKYHSQYGGRFANELKLETEDLDTNPEYIVKLLLLYSESKVNEMGPNKMNLKTLNLSFNKRLYLKYLLNKIKFYARKREELRLLRAQSFGIARKIFLEVGNKLKDKGIMGKPEDIFYLEIEEVINYIHKKLKDKDLNEKRENQRLSEKISSRKMIFEEYKKESPEDVFYTYGDSIESKFTKQNDTNNDFIGQGCSPGIIKGKVKILEKFSLPDMEEFDIIVTKHTDPGWTPLFGLCNGIIVEHGGVLSHAAIISRELNLPCVIGLKNATTILKDGQTITLNGYTGEVIIHD
jgi:rifampicin phosphotransferase